MPSAAGAVVLGLMVFIVAAVLLPLVLEVALTLLQGFFPHIRSSAQALRLSRMSHLISDRAESGVALLVLLMILVPIYIHFSDLVPFFAGVQHAAHGESWTHILLLHVLPSVVINSNMIAFFYLATFTPAGPPNAASGIDMTTSVKCRFCKTPKPLRVSHCSSCNTCVVDMDHHCSFTVNCVGHGNYRYFFAFVMWGWLATLYAVWLAHHPFSHCHPSLEEDDRHPLCESWPKSAERVFYLATAAFAVISGFFFLLLFLLMSGRTLRGLLDTRGTPPSLPQYPTIFGQMQSRLGPASDWWLFLIPVPPLQRQRSHDAF
eukprot:m.23436 g.23436  ORF g.23436 m.23436 type:complete len:318 (-) comp4122_c0_seq1:138-1091(-)